MNGYIIVHAVSTYFWSYNPLFCLQVENTIRWRYIHDELGNPKYDELGNQKKESNARIVKWSDGRLVRVSTVVPMMFGVKCERLNVYFSIAWLYKKK